MIKISARCALEKKPGNGAKYGRLAVIIIVQFEITQIFRQQGYPKRTGYATLGICWRSKAFY
jgi:hypothetical protein